MRKIFIVDYIGTHCGMDYYLDAFKKVISCLENTEVRILSNFPEKTTSDVFFINQYQGPIWRKAFSLARNLMRLKKYVMKHPEDVFIYLSYGNAIDLFFMNIVAKAPGHVIDIHEAIAQNVDGNESLLRKFAYIYSKKIKTIISHSARTDNYLRQFGFSGKRFNVPHFKYAIQKEYDINSVARDIQEAFSADKKNILFFGNLNESKGVDILMQSINLLDDETASRLNFIIAGKDFDGAINRTEIKCKDRVSLFPRHISDDELRFMYANADFVTLPYRKTSQSGILEMAFHFRKPVIVSQLPYFEKTLKEFPSFGLIFGNDEKALAAAFQKIAASDTTEYFTERDYSKFENRKEISDFISDFSHWLERN